MFKLLTIYVLFPCTMLLSFVDGDMDYEYSKKGSEEKKNIFSHFLFSFGSSSFFDYSRKSDMINKKNSYSWNARISSADRIKILAGNYHAKFSSGMILSRLNSASNNPFLSSTMRTQSDPFLPETNANINDSLFGSAISYSIMNLDSVKLKIHMFYSDKKSYITSSEYEENETNRSYLSLNSSDVLDKEEIVSSKISGYSLCFSYQLLKINVNGLYSLAESSSGRLYSQGNDHYSASSLYLSFGIKQSEIFTEMCFSSSEDICSAETLSYQYGMKYVEKKYMISFVGKNMSEKINLPFGSPCRGKTPSMQYSFAGYLYMTDKIKTGAEIEQTQYKKMSQSETHLINEKIFGEIEVVKNLYINGDYCRTKYYWKTDEVSDALSAEMKLFLKHVVLNHSFSKNDARKKIKSEFETRSLNAFCANMYYVCILGKDSYYSTRNNLSLSTKYTYKKITSSLSYTKGFGKGQKYTRFVFSISGLI